MREYWIYTDESSKEGPYFANFYGGALVRSGHLEEVREAIADAKVRLGLGAECKWQKVSGAYLERYRELMDVFFDLIAEDLVKVRIMFTQRRFVPTGLTPAQRENTYQLLYYQFLKHAFGLRHSNNRGDPIRLRIYLDHLPENREKVAQFKGFVAALQQSPEFREARILVPPNQIAEVSSHDHDILQCLDVVLGAMHFRLNNFHEQKPPGQRTRGKKTIAKEKLYKHINGRIRDIYPGFNVGISTGKPGGWEDRWRHPYRHWLFVPSDREIDNSRNKP